jgi:hypothetical protein
MMDVARAIPEKEKQKTLIVVLRAGPDNWMLQITC